MASLAFGIIIVMALITFGTVVYLNSNFETQQNIHKLQNENEFLGENISNELSTPIQQIVYPFGVFPETEPVLVKSKFSLGGKCGEFQYKCLPFQYFTCDKNVGKCNKIEESDFDCSSDGITKGECFSYYFDYLNYQSTKTYDDYRDDDFGMGNAFWKP